jgi:hypothetical protein
VIFSQYQLYTLGVNKMQKNNSQVKKGIGLLGAFAGAALYIATLSGCPSPTPGPGPDTEAPTVPSNFKGVAQGNGEILYTWNASSDNVGVDGYQLKLSLYNIPNPSVPKDASDITDLGSLSGSTLDQLVNALEAGVGYTAWVRAKDAAGNYSDWAKVVDVISGGVPLLPFEPWGKINGGSIANGKAVSAKDKYDNVIDSKVGSYGVTSGGFYGLEILNRKTGMPITIVCQDYVPTGATTIKSGSERLDF